MNRSRFLLSLLYFSIPLLVQCASVSHAPAEDSESAKGFEALDDRAVVYLYRPGRAIGAALATQIQVNGIDAGGTGPGSFFRWELKPGKYTFSASTNESSKTAALDVEAGKLYFMEQNERLGLTQGGRVTLNVVDEAKGKKAVTGMKLLVSAYVPE